MHIPLLRLPHALDLPIPIYATDGAAGMDVHAAVAEPTIIEPGAIALIPTGLSMAIPAGFECQVRSRSGLAAKNGIFALNAPGTIDSDYRGEVQIILANFSKTPFVIERGSRIAQLVIARHERAEWVEVSSLSETVRADGGFGSTGVHP